MHLYGGDACQEEAAHRAKFVTAIEAFREFTLTTRGGHYEDCPMILTEFNGMYDETFGSFTMPETVRFLEDFEADLSALWLRGILSEWFWFVSNATGSWAYCSILADSVTLSDTGVAYRDAAVRWQAEAPASADRWLRLE
jgi:hypothetical protein